MHKITIVLMIFSFLNPHIQSSIEILYTFILSIFHKFIMPNNTLAIRHLTPELLQGLFNWSFYSNILAQSILPKSSVRLIILKHQTTKLIQSHFH